MPAEILFVHESQHPASLNRELVLCLRKRKLKLKFLYDSPGLTARWLALHQAISPAARASDFSRTYAPAFAKAAELVMNRPVSVVSLGCGGGTKDAALLRKLKERGNAIGYTALDASSAMVHAASDQAREILDSSRCARIVCDVENTPDLGDLVSSVERGFSGKKSGSKWARRIVLFLGMLPGVVPPDAKRILRGILRPDDLLIVSANLAAGEDYEEGMRKVLPQYDNEPCREWLLSFLDYVGIDRKAGSLQFAIEDGGGLKAIVADFVFKRDCSVHILEEQVIFPRGQKQRLFHSFRHSNETFTAFVKKCGFDTAAQWTSCSGEESVCLAR